MVFKVYFSKERKERRREGGGRREGGEGGKKRQCSGRGWIEQGLPLPHPLVNLILQLSQDPLIGLWGQRHNVFTERLGPGPFQKGNYKAEGGKGEV